MAKEFNPDTGGTLTTGLLAYWRMNEASGDAVCEVNTDRNLTDVNTVTAGASVNSTRLTTRSFAAATSERLSHASDAVLERGATSFSFAFWYKTTTVAADEDDIFAKYSSGANRQYICFRNGDDLFFNAYIGDAPSVTKADVLAADTWIFVVCGYDAAGSQLFISTNGGAYTTANVTGTGVSGSTGEFNIGASLDTGTYYNFINGEVDEVGFWSKKLSDQEVDDLYNAGTGNTYKEPDAPVAAGGTNHWLLMGV